MSTQPEAAPLTAANPLRPQTAIDATPPITPNLVRRREIPGARQVGRNTLETLLFRGLSTPIALVLVILQSRFLHPDGRGAFVLAVLSVTICSRLLGQLGIAITSRLGQGQADLRHLILRAFAIAGVFGTAGVAALAAWGHGTDSLGIGLAALAALALIPNIVWQTISGVLLGVARVRLWNYIQLLPPVLTAAGMVVLVVVIEGGVYGAILAWVIANAITAGFALAVTRELWLPLALPRIADRHGRTLVRLALVLGAVQVVNLISYRIELFILDRYQGLAEVGIYSIAMQAAEAMWLIPAAVATAITAPVVHETEPRAASLVARGAARGLLYTAGVAVVVGSAGPFAIPFVFGEAFADAATPLALLLPGVVAYAPVTVLVVYLSVRAGRPRLSLAVSVAAMVVTTVGAVVLIPRYGGAGAALSSTIGYVAGALLAWGLFERLRRTRVSVTEPASRSR